MTVKRMDNVGIVVEDIDAAAACFIQVMCLHRKNRVMGIISFEFAGELPVARSMLASWGTKGQLIASFSLGLDYLFILAYVMAIGLGCASIAQISYLLGAQ